MGMAKYKEDNMNRWYESNTTRKNLSGVTVDGLVIGNPSGRRKEAVNERSYIIRTDGFTITGNAVQIHTSDTKTFHALRLSLKDHDAHFDVSKKSWILSYEQLDNWISVQAGYGWFCS